MITVADEANADTKKFHIIHPVVVNHVTRSCGRMSKCNWCSVRCLSSTRPAPCMMHFGLPVVPEEYST